MTLPFPVLVLAVVFLLIAARQVVHTRLRIWQVMLGGALAVLATGDITPAAAAQAIDLDVMLFLFGMFAVGRALELSGYLAYLSYRLFSRARSVRQLILRVMLGMGLASAFLMNDTLAIVGTPVMLLLARAHGIPAKPLLLALALAVTTGSVMSPIGNPQNLLIAVHGGLANPFLDFPGALFLPTAVSLLCAYFLLRRYYPEPFHDNPLLHAEPRIRDLALARLCRASLALIVGLVAFKITLAFTSPGTEFRLTYIALAAAVPVLLLGRRRARILRSLDWPTLVFFAAMFVLMHSVWDTGLFQALIHWQGLDVTAIPVILAVSVLLSQLISNVPLVALYLPMLVEAGAGSPQMLALAAGSTLAGNLSILGAASNVIIVHGAEVRGGETLSFLEFARIGVPVTAIQVLIYWLFLRLA